MKVLLTSVGRRAYLVRYFKNALGENGEVHVCNSDDKSIAFKYADKKIISPLVYDESYIPFLVEYCKNNKIDFLLSLFDIDLLVLAKNKDKFEKSGTRLVVSNPDIISVCNDKWLTHDFLIENGFRAPKTYLNLCAVEKEIEEGKLMFPIVVKPRFGCGSISVETAHDREDLVYLTKKIKREINNTYLKYESSVTNENVIYQEYLNGQEYGADIINDLNGTIQNVIVRKKIAMRSGETDIAELVDAPIIKAELMKLGKVTNHIANMDCDIFLVNGAPFILEMNARLGGGYPFSHIGGCNLPLAIIKWIKGKSVPVEMISSKTGIIGFKEISIQKM